MGTYEAGQSSKRNLTQNSTGTYAVTIPKELIKALKWRQGQKLIVKKQGSKIIIEDWSE